MQCPRCQAPVDEDVNFCQACGASLATQCLKCDTELRADAVSCPSCGINQKQYVKDRTAALTRLLTKARELAAGGKLAPAVHCLAEATVEKHDAFADLVGEAGRLQKEYKDEEERIAATNLRVASRAEKALSSGNYHEAKTLIEQIPPAVWDRKLKQLYERACERWSWLAERAQEVRNLVRHREYREARAVLQEVSRTCPGDVAIQRTLQEAAVRAKRHNLEEADAALRKEEYDRAIELWKDALLEGPSLGTKLVDVDAVNVERDILASENLREARNCLAKNDLAGASTALVEAQEIRSINPRIIEHIEATIDEIDAVQARTARRKALRIAVPVAVGVLVVLALVLLTAT